MAAMRHCLRFLLSLFIEIVFQLVGMVWESKLPDYAGSNEAATGLPKLLFQALLWGSYMLVSNRVKATFVRRRGLSTPPELHSR
jgi:hypothetical protein